MLTITYDETVSIDFPSYLKEDAAWYKLAEKNTKKYFLSCIKPNYTIIDAGAQIGMYSVLFSKLAIKGKVVCFEPTSNAALLRQNLDYHDCANVEIQHVALSNKDGEYEDVIFKQWSQNVIDKRKFTFSTIDTFVKSRNLKIDLLKIDVDSYDFEVLLGSKNTLMEQTPTVVVELNHALGKRGYKKEDAMEYMKLLQYELDVVLDHENYVFTKKTVTL